MTEQKCNSTKEELRADGYKNVDDCPVCLRHENFQWAVGDHRSAPPAPIPGIVSTALEIHCVINSTGCIRISFPQYLFHFDFPCFLGTFCKLC